MSAEFRSNRCPNRNESQRLRDRCPRFIQFARGQLRWEDSAGSVKFEVDYDQAEVAARQPWVAFGGGVAVDDFIVDRAFVGDDPVYGVLLAQPGEDGTPTIGLVEVRGFSQDWSDGFAVMYDTPGYAFEGGEAVPPGGPPDAEDPVTGDRIILTFEFETWIIGPRLPQLPDCAVQEPCPGVSPPAGQRVPFGYIEWGFQIRVVMGEDMDSTTFEFLQEPHFQRHDAAATDRYIQMMTNNYPAWVP